MQDPRKTALCIFTLLQREHRSLTELLDRYLPDLALQERKFCQALVFQAARYFYQTDSHLSKSLQKPLREKDQDLQILLILGLTEAQHLSTPDHALVSEWLKQIPKQKPWAKGLVNAILRQACRDRLALISKPDHQETDHGKTHPQWFVQKIQQAWPVQASKIFEYNDIQGPMTLRVHLSKTSREDYLQTLTHHHNIAGEPASTAESIILTTPQEVLSLPGFQEGWVSIQDEAAQWAAHLLDPKPNERILDACAAPGGKTGHLLSLEPTLQLTAIDLSKERLARLQETLQRLGLSAKCITGDLTCPDLLDQQCFDKILLDAPCSATGVIRRHPDIKILRQKQDITQLAHTQEQMLNHLWSHLAPHGILLYATCSILPEENENQIQNFLQQHPDARVIPISFPENLRLWGEATPSHSFQFFPCAARHDGFFYARLQKIC